MLLRINAVLPQVKGHSKLSRESRGIIPVVSAVLAASQNFMRDQKVKLLAWALI